MAEPEAPDEIGLPGTRRDAGERLVLDVDHPDESVARDHLPGKASDADHVGHLARVGVELDERVRHDRRELSLPGQESCQGSGDCSDGDYQSDHCQPAAPSSARLAFGRRSGRRQLEGGILVEDRLFEAAERCAGLEAEFADEESPSLLIDVESLCLSPAAVEREHQLAAQLLAQWVPGDERLEFCDRVGVPAERKLGFESFLERPQAKLFQPQGLRVCERRRVDVRQRSTAPERERLREALQRLGRVAGGERGASFVHEPLEAAEVDRLRVDPQEVAGSPGDDLSGPSALRKPET